MGFAAYQSVLRLPTVRRVLLLGIVMRIPLWATNVVITLHVVGHLDRSYGAAGLLSAVVTVALAVSAPWRGRRLDQVGLRRTVAPSLIVLAACWSVAPFVGYGLLLLLAGVAGLFTVPTFSIVRQALIGAVGPEHRKTVLSMDSVAIEISFMVGPAAGVLLATYVPTSWALFACAFTTLAADVLLWVENPALGSAEPGDEPGAVQPGGRFAWVRLEAVAVLGMAAAATLVLTGTDVGTVAALRHLHHQSWIGWVLGIWGLGSAVGGFVYGALHRSIPVAVLLGLLAGTTVPVALAAEPFSLAALLLVAGVFCAPTITATLDELSRIVPPSVRGEALGWHGSAMTIGSALGAPLAGVAIDAVGWRGGFLLAGCLG
ncbi:MAG TPA: MFS transporter, partial [Jatrophihabitans sp.]|nr:MFS transporter [Jatrophihabitans sp.]